MLKGILLTILLAVQGIPILPGSGGTVSGTLRGTDGKPAAGLRVAAMARPDVGNTAGTATSLVSITQTDDNGRYRLEDIPPGQYYIVAERVTLPTYYPGTQ